MKPITVTNFLADTLLEYQRSDSREFLTRFDDHVHVEVGGFVDSVGTHFSRMKWADSITQGERFVMSAVIDLPADFYDKLQTSVKVVTFGTQDPYLRAGMWIDSSQLPRLQFERKGYGLKLLWQGKERLPLGRHEIKIEAIPSATDGKALTRLFVDGIKWGESTKPNTYSAYKVNRFVWGLDGAAGQDTKRVALDIYKASVDAWVDPCADLRKRLEIADMALEDARLAYEEAQLEYNKILVELQANGC